MACRVRVRVRGTEGTIEVSAESQFHYVSTTISRALELHPNSIQSIRFGQRVVTAKDSFASLKVGDSAIFEVQVASVHCGGSGTRRCIACFKFVIEAKMDETGVCKRCLWARVNCDHNDSEDLWCNTSLRLLHTLEAVREAREEARHKAGATNEHDPAPRCKPRVASHLRIAESLSAVQALVRQQLPARETCPRCGRCGLHAGTRCCGMYAGVSQ